MPPPVEKWFPCACKCASDRAKHYSTQCAFAISIPIVYAFLHRFGHIALAAAGEFSEAAPSTAIRRNYSYETHRPVNACACWTGNSATDRETEPDVGTGMKVMVLLGAMKSFAVVGSVTGCFQETFKDPSLQSFFPRISYSACVVTSLNFFYFTYFQAYKNHKINSGDQCYIEGVL